MKTKKSLKGFTLIELITVIMIIGILATILVPTIVNYVKKATIAAAIEDTRIIKNAVENALVDRLLIGTTTQNNAFNKVLNLDQNKDATKRKTENVGAFTTRSWYYYRTKKNVAGKSQEIDTCIASAIDNAFSEHWDNGADKNPMGYNTDTRNCKLFTQENKTNFGIVVVYNKTGSVRLLQLYRKGILVTYVNGEYIANTEDNAHFVGDGVWSSIYADAKSDKETAEELYSVNLVNGQIINGKLTKGWMG